MDHEIRNALVGGITLIVLVIFGGFAFSGTGDRVPDGFSISASFDQIDGLGVGDQVRIAGVPIGQVEKLALAKDYRAVVTLRMLEGTKIPDDSDAAIHTDGLFGAKFITLNAGGGDDLEAGGEITVTQGSLVLQDLLNLIIGQAKANRAKAGKDAAKK